MELQPITMAQAVKLEKQEFAGDLSIARRAVTGDSEAFLALYQQNLPRVYAVCMRIVANRDQAEEVTQQALIRTWEMLDSYRGESPLSAWIHRIAAHAALDYLRARKRLTKRVVFTDNLEVFEHPDPSSPREIPMDIEHALSALPPQARTVVVLHDIRRIFSQ